MHGDEEEERSSDGPPGGVYKRIGQLLVEADVITAVQLEEALEVQQMRGGRLVEILITLNYMKPASFVDFLARLPGVASIDLLNYTIPAEIIRHVPRELALKHDVFPIDQLGKLLTLGMACPIDAGAILELEQVTGLRVKAMLCSATDIRAAIQRYYPSPLEQHLELWHISEEGRRGVGSAIKLHTAARLVRQMRNLPALAETVDSVRRAMLEMQTSISDVVGIVGRDPAMVAKVLSVANSPAYGFPGHVNDLEKAVTLMGLRETYSIALSASIMHAPPRTSCFDYRGFWVSAMTCAQHAQRASELSGRSNSQAAYWAGLLHDLGRIVLLSVAPDLYGTLSPSTQGAALIAAEEDLFGLAHTEAGFELAVDWNLPMDITESIRFHHAPERATGAKDTVAAVALAETLVQSHRGDLDAENEDLCAHCLGILNIAKSKRKSFLKDLGDVEAIRTHWTAQWDVPRLAHPRGN